MPPVATPLPATASRPGSAWAAWGVVIAVCLARFAFGYQLQTVASLGPDLVRELRLDFTAIGALIGAYMLPGIAAALLFGFLAQRIGDFATLLTGLLLMTLGGVGAALAGGAHGIGAARAVAGLGAVVLTVLQSKIVADRFQGRAFMLPLGLVLGTFPIGIGIGQIVHGDIARAFGWQATFLSGALPAALALLVLLVSWRAGAHAPPRSMSWPSARECRQVALAGLVWTFYTGGFIGFLSYTPALMALRGEPRWVTDVVMNLATWGNLPAILFGGALAARFGANLVFAVGMAVAVLCVAAMPLAGWPLALGAVYGTVGAMHGTVIVSAGTLSARPAFRAVGMALFYTLYYVGSTVFPILCGRAADLAGGPHGALLAAAAISAFAFPCWVLHRRGARGG